MEWYRYNPETSEYEHPVICQPNPARPGEYLIPPSATPLEPPRVENKQIAQFNINLKQWSIQPDYRGTEYWLPDGSQHKIETIGEVPPENALFDPPPPKPPTPEEEYAEMIRQRDQMLDKNDWTILRHKDQIELEIPTTLSPEGYKNTLIWRQQLRDMPQTFGSYKAGGPVPKWTWPPVPPELEDDFPDYPPA